MLVAEARRYTHYWKRGEGEIGVGPNRKTLPDSFERTREEKIGKVYCACKAGAIGICASRQKYFSGEKSFRQGSFAFAQFALAKLQEFASHPSAK